MRNKYMVAWEADLCGDIKGDYSLFDCDCDESLGMYYLVNAETRLEAVEYFLDVEYSILIDRVTSMEYDEELFRLFVEAARLGCSQEDFCDFSLGGEVYKLAKNIENRGKNKKKQSFETKCKKVSDEFNPTELTGLLLNQNEKKELWKILQKYNVAVIALQKI